MKARLLLLALCGLCGVLSAAALAGRTTVHADGSEADATIVATELTLARFQAGDARATCPTGTRVVGGGVGADSDPEAFWVRQSGPLDPSGVFASTNTGDVAISWFGDVANNTASNLLVKVFAICSKSSDALVVAAPLDVGPHNVGVARPTCPSGSRALGGGVGVVVGNSALEYVQRSGPLDDSGSFARTPAGDYASSWYVSMYNGAADQHAFKAFALCSSSSKATLAKATVSVLPGSGGGDTATCPAGSVAVGGGLGSDGIDALPDYVKASGPRRAGGSGDDVRTGDVANGWYASFHNGDASTRDLAVFAICAKAAAPTTTSAPTTTARSTTTVTTTTATTTTVMTATTTTPAIAKLAARLAGVTVLGRGNTRTLRVTVGVSAAGRARVRLLRQGLVRASKLVSLHAGSNPVRLALPATLKQGSYRLTVAIRSGQQLATATAPVTLETRGG
jgi:hypothetical protein